VIVALVALAVFAPMVAEAVVSRRHERVLRAAGAIEPAGDVYRVMQAAYPAAFLVMIAEGLWRGAATGAVFVGGAALFAAAKILKYWAIETLGVRWTFRVLVPPGSHPIAGGPYRRLRHPNYLAVVGELAGTACMTRALVAGPLATLGFAALMLARIRVENRAIRVQRR
jgi:methyltransferase